MLPRSTEIQPYVASIRPSNSLPSPSNSIPSTIERSRAGGLTIYPRPPENSDQVFETYVTFSIRWRIWFLEISPESVKNSPCAKTNKSYLADCSALVNFRKPIRPSFYLCRPSCRIGFEKSVGPWRESYTGNEAGSENDKSRTCRKQ